MFQKTRFQQSRQGSLGNRKQRIGHPARTLPTEEMVLMALGTVLGAAAKIGMGFASNARKKEDYYRQRRHFEDDRKFSMDLAERHRTEDWQRTEALNKFGYDAQKEFAQNSTGWAFDDLMESADEAGIHRLAAIGGAQGVGYTPAATSGAGQGATIPDFSPSVVPGAEQFIGDAVGDGINQIMNSKRQQLQDCIGEAELARLEVEIREINAATSRTQIQNVRQITQGQTQPDEQVDVAGQPLLGNLAVAGGPLAPNPNWSDAEFIEGRYGDVVSWLYGVGVTVADINQWIGTKNHRWKSLQDAAKNMNKRQRENVLAMAKRNAKTRVNVSKSNADTTDNARAQRTNTGGY